MSYLLLSVFPSYRQLGHVRCWQTSAWEHTSGLCSHISQGIQWQNHLQHTKKHHNLMLRYQWNCHYVSLFHTINEDRSTFSCSDNHRRYLTCNGCAPTSSQNCLSALYHMRLYQCVLHLLTEYMLL